MNNKQVLKAALAKRSAEKKNGTYVGFDAMKAKLAKRPGVTNPGALAAYIGRRKFGSKGFAALGRYGKEHKG